MINLMYIVFIALMGLGIHEDKEDDSPRSVEANSPHPSPIATDTLGQALGQSPREDIVLNARAIPQSRRVIQGTSYEAELRLVEASEHKPKRIVVSGQALPAEQHSYRVLAQRPGEHRYSGYIEWEDAEGRLRKSPFEERYEVIEPSIAIAPTLMQVLYAGIDNKLNISASGIAREALRLSAEGADVRREGTFFVIKPHRSEGSIKLNISTQIEGGKLLPLGQHELRVRPLPPPTAYLALHSGEGSKMRFKGGRIAKQQLLSAEGLSAAIDDGILDVSFAVQSFQVISFDALGNAIPEVSAGAKFSSRQIEQIRQSPRGKRLYITEIVARGPDAAVHRLSPIELILQ